MQDNFFFNIFCLKIFETSFKIYVCDKKEKVEIT